ncbi:MAG: aminotransferase class V-fold PLP-dependent enzyme [Acidobacteriota bacterium]|nr:aminotransferase class V-fold PLP-dependent enzyme [Acidobacteriota bacterium]
MGPLLATRDRFPILATSTYLINNSLGAMPEDAEAGRARYAREWRELGVRAWAEHWWSLGDRVADQVAPILGAPSGSVSMQPSTTVATATFLSCLRPSGSRRRIVTTELQFPSILYLTESWCRAHAAELIVVPKSHRYGTDLEALLSVIDDDVLAVVVSHVEFATAWINEAEALARHCRLHGARLLLDVFQSAGVLPLELEAWGVDAAVGGCLKWLCGGPGNAFLYVDPRIADELEPTLTGWLAHQAPFAFEPPPMRFRDGGSRFLNGTPQIAALYAAGPGLEIIRKYGIHAIRSKSKDLGTLLCEQARSRGLELACTTDPDARGGTVTLDVPHAEGVARELADRAVIVDYRPGYGLRIAPHFYNTAKECLHCLAQIEAILADGSWARHRGVSGTAPT